MDVEKASEFVRLMPYLSELYDSDEPVRQAELKELVGKSKSTVHRSIKSLQEAGVVKEARGGYILTDLGEVIAGRTCDYVSEIRAAKKCKDFHKTITETDIPLEAVSNAKITRVSQENPVAPLIRLAEVTAKAEKVRVLTNSIAPESFEVGRQGIREGDKQVKMVIDRRTVESIRGSEWLGEELKEDLRTGNLELWVHESPVPHQIGIMDGRLCLGAEDENRMPIAILETEKKEAVNWASEVFERHKARSSKLEGI